MAHTETATRWHIGIDWMAVLWASVIAGAIFMMMEMTLVAATGMGGFWGPPRMMAAMVLGKEVLPPPASFDMGIVVVAMMIHLPLSFIYALALAALVSRVGAAAALTWGAAFGFAIYVLNFYVIAPLWFPWFVEARGWVGLVSHTVYGMAFGGSYRVLALS